MQHESEAAVDPVAARLRLLAAAAELIEPADA
jgi:hypothetical protein